MKQKTISVENYCYNNRNPFINRYFNNLLLNSIKLSEYWKIDNPSILDFGCNCQQLKRILIGYLNTDHNHKLIKINYIGYDIDKKYTDIDNYKKLKPDIIFCINVLEHLTKEELIETFINFKRMNKDLILVTAIPKMNWLSNFLNNNFDPVNENKEYEIHKTHFKEIQRLLNLNFRLIREKDYMLIQKLQVWKIKKVKSIFN